MLYKNNKIIGYIRYDNRVYEKSSEKCIKLFRKIFIKVNIEFIENGVIIVIPQYKNYNKKVLNIIINQLNLYIKKYKIDYLVFEDNMQFLKDNFTNINTLNGKIFMKFSLLKILEYIFDINQKNMNLENVYIFVNQYTKNNIYIIETLIKKFRTVNIITENLKFYKNLENSLYKEGILITVSNNKHKSAKNAKYIINMDFEKETFEKYNINMKSIIINLTNESNFFEKNFNGLLINNFEICMNKDMMSFINEFYGNINEKIYIESLLCSGEECYEKVEELNKQYGSEVFSLTGVRGLLQKCEFLV